MIAQKIKKAKKSLSVKVNAMFAAMLPAVLFAQEQLPLLKELMTVEVYQVVGLSVVLLNIYFKLRD